MNGRDALRDRVERAVGALFSVEEEIGRGGMAVVYRARDVRLRRKVALKVLPPELAFRDDVKSRFLREAQMSAQLSHPNIVPIYAVDELDGIVFFAMGLVEGETLAQQLAHSPRPDVETVRRVLREVADALGYAHANHVVHRDVKPDNILIEAATGRALVSDFGIARAAEGDSRLTKGREGSEPSRRRHSLCPFDRRDQHTGECGRTRMSDRPPASSERSVPDRR